jgi:hypothetical protein
VLYLADPGSETQHSPFAAHQNCIWSLAVPFLHSCSKPTMATSPTSQHPPPFYPRHSSRPSSLHHSRSSSVESRPRGRSTYSHHRSSSQDSLYLSMDSSCGPIQRWDGLAREATDWNSLRRDPELYIPVGNCMVFLYAAGSSQRGPSFRIPYDLLLYSGCRPLIDRCLMGTSTSEYHPASSTPPSYDTMDYQSEENCSFLYLPAPAGLSGDESYVYHLTTRNFFAWLLGVPLVGTDPVSALLDLKMRMDVWRDHGSGNFGALFDYVKEQGYGDFEALEIEMGKRLNADVHEANSTLGFPPTNPMVFNEQSTPKDEGKTSRRNSLTQRIRRRFSRSRGRGEERAGSTGPRQTDVEARLQTFRMNSYTHGPPPPSAEHISATMQRLAGPSSAQSANAMRNTQSEIEEKMTKRRSWTNIVGNAWKRTSMANVSLPPLQTQQPQPVGLFPFEGPHSLLYAHQPASEPTSAVVEKKRRLSWKRTSVTDITLSSPQTQQLQPITSSASNGPSSAPEPISTQSRDLPLVSAPAPAEEKRKRRLSWANVSDKIFDIMMPPMSKDDLAPPAAESQEGVSATVSKSSELQATQVAPETSSSPAAIAVPTTGVTPTSAPAAAGSATRSSSRHPSIHDFSTGQEVCACCGKVRQRRPESSAGPSRTSTINVRDGKEAGGLGPASTDANAKDALENLHDHMKARRNTFKSKSHKEIIVPGYGNGTRGQTTDTRNRPTTSIDTAVPTVQVRTTDAGKIKTPRDAGHSPNTLEWTSNARKGKTRSIDAIVAPVELRTADLKKINAQPADGAVSSVKVRPETSVLVPAGPMSTPDLVASPVSITEPSATPSTPYSSSLQEYRRSARPASLDYGGRASASATDGLPSTSSGRGGDNSIPDIHYSVTTARESAPASGSASARPGMKTLGQTQGVEQDQFRVVDVDFELNIEDLLAQLETAGIS